MAYIYKKWAQSGEYEYVCDEVEYEPSIDEIRQKIAELLFDEYFNRSEIVLASPEQKNAIIKSIYDLTDDNDNWEQWEEYFKEDLYEAFRFEALRDE